MHCLWNVFHSKYYDMNNGVPQGDPLSPIISVLYISTILKQIFPYTSNSSATCLCYINDYVLVTDSPSLRTNIAKLQDTYTSLEDAFDEWDCELNT